MKRKKLLFTFQNFSSFVKTDYEILSSEFEVIQYPFRPVRGSFNALVELFKQARFLLVNIWKVDYTFTWFADFHSLLPVFFSNLAGKKSIVVVGGYDVCRIPSLGYGVFCSKSRGFSAIYSMKKCTLSLPVSNYVARKVKALTRNNRFKMLYNCVDFRAPEKMDHINRSMVLTIGYINSERAYLLKGIDTFVEVARLLPEISFCIAGFNPIGLEYKQKDFPANIQVTGLVRHEALPEIYSRTKIYCQLSRSESFGLSLAEAIFHGCIPVATNEGGMPEVVGDKKYIFKRDPVQIAGFIRNNLHLPESGLKISDKFSKETRATKLKAIIHGLI